jgi:acetyl esterase/lipase
MQAGHSQSVALGGNSAGGTLVLNGATLAFVVLCKQYSPPPVMAVGDGAPHH